MTRNRTAYNSARRIAKAAAGHPAANASFNLTVEPQPISLRAQMESLRSTMAPGELAEDVLAFETQIGANSKSGSPGLRLVGGSRSNGSGSAGLTF